MDEKILQNFPTTLYLLKVAVNNSLKIIDFKLINHGKNTQYSEEEFTKELIANNFKDSDLQKFAKILKEKKDDKIEIKYQFKDKNGKIHTFKDILKIMEKKDNIYTLLGLGINISKEEELSQIFEAVTESNHMGILIYKEKIVFCDNYAKKLLEAGDEIYKISPAELFPDFMKPNIQKIIKERLNGKRFGKYYSLELPTFKKNRKYVEFYGYTITYEGEYAGFVIILDKTKFFKHKKMLEIIKNVNSILLKQIFNKQILLDEIITHIKKTSYFKNVFLSNKEIKEKGFLSLKITDEFLIFEAKYNNDFDELCIDTLKEIQKNIQKTINDINKNLTLMILKQALEQSFQWLLITDENGKIIYTNDAVTKISGYSKKELLGKSPSVFKSGKHDESLYKQLWKSILNDKIYETTFKNKNKNNQLFYLKNKILPVNLPNGKKYYVSMGIDITLQKQLEDKITDIKFKDKLTDLYNRNGFILTGSEKLYSANKKYALAVIDIKDFRAINAIKGNKFGDELLEQFAILLKIFFHKNSLIGRIGNDEFAVLTEIEDINQFEEKIKTFIKIIKKLEIQSFKISLNIGISVFPDDNKEIESLIEKALTALEHAKKEGEYTYVFYNKNLSKNLQKNIQIKSLINDALKNDKFIYCFQPYVLSKDFSIACAESLIRIKDGEKIIRPSKFIDYAETSGMIKDIELIMAKKASKILKSSPIPLSFNISAVSLKDSNHLSKLINITKPYAEKIIVEITERELIFNTEEIIKKFDQLKNLGYKIAIDDFGTGYSSFSYIKNIPLDFLKIDISFIKNIEKCEKDLAITDAIINFSKKLGIKTIAEGIETRKQAEILKNLGCDYLQGFYFYKPMTFEELKKQIKNQKTLDN